LCPNKSNFFLSEEKDEPCLVQYEIDNLVIKRYDHCIIEPSTNLQPLTLRVGRTYVAGEKDSPWYGRVEDVLVFLYGLRRVVLCKIKWWQIVENPSPKIFSIMPYRNLYQQRDETDPILFDPKHFHSEFFGAPVITNSPELHFYVHPIYRDGLLGYSQFF
jgi:hypothetical protein